MTYPAHPTDPPPPEDRAAVAVAWGVLGLAAVAAAGLLTWLITLVENP